MITLQFSSFAEMQQHAVAAFKPYNTRLVLRHGMTASAHMIKQRAVGMLGTYQAAAGPFGAWPELAESTKNRRAARGYRPNDPLYVTGKLSKSYEVDAEGDSVGVGSELPAALGMEIGVPAKNVPARPVLGIAFVQSEKHAFAALVDVVGALVTTRNPALIPVAARLIAMKYERMNVMYP